MRCLEIGGGPSPAHPDWEQADCNDWADRGNPTTMLCDARHLDAGDCEFDEVFASNVLEHFSFLETAEVLKEWARVLKHDGFLTLVVPDLLGIFRDHTTGRNTFTEFVERVYGSQTYDVDLHRAGFTVGLEMESLICSAGLTLVSQESSHAGGGVTVKAWKL